MTVSGDIISIFRGEAGERVDRIVEVLLSVERGDATPEAADALMRELHSVKGAAAIVGLDDVSSLAHAMEESLGDARTSGAVAAELVEPLLRAADDLREAIAGRSPAPATATSAAAPGPAADVPPPGREAPPPETDRRTSIRVDAGRVDRLLDLAGEAALHHRRMAHALAPEVRTHVVDDLLDEGDMLLTGLHESTLELRTVELSTVTGQFTRAVRDLAHEQGKEIAFEVDGDSIRLDRALLEGTGDALTHILRNAVDHAIETPDVRERVGKSRQGHIHLRGEQQGDRVCIEVSDDGRGVSSELLTRGRHAGSLAAVLSEPGLSTAPSVTHLSGRGVGLDAVRRHAEAVGGTLEIESVPGEGTAVRLVLPVTLAVTHVLLTERAGQVYGVPMSGVTSAVTVDSHMSLRGQRSIEFDGDSLRAADLLTLLGGSGEALPPRPTAIVVNAPAGRVAVLCDRVAGEEDLVVKPLGRLLSTTPGYLGAALRGDGRLALVLDPAHLARAVAMGQADRPASPAGSPLATAAPTARRVLVVDDQFTVRELQRSILEAAGYRVTTARDGQEAWRMLLDDGSADLVVTDIEMPHMDGIELLQAIRARPALESLPVVVVTSRAGKDDERRGLEAGADAYISKGGFDQQALLDTVGRLIGS